MDESAIDVSILSVAAYLPCPIGEEDRRIARQKNSELAQICRSFPTRFGFFATLPNLDDVDGLSVLIFHSIDSLSSLGTLAEIAYALDELKADGVAISSSCGIVPNAS